MNHYSQISQSGTTGPSDIFKKEKHASKCHSLKLSYKDFQFQFDCWSVFVLGYVQSSWAQSSFSYGLCLYNTYFPNPGYEDEEGFLKEKS